MNIEDESERILEREYTARERAAEREHALKMKKVEELSACSPWMVLAAIFGMILGAILAHCGHVKIERNQLKLENAGLRKAMEP